MSETHQRRIYLVDRRFQLKYVALLMGWGIVLSVLFGLWTYQAHQQALETVLRDSAQRALLARGERQLAWALAGIGALSAAALGLIAFVMSHRVAGPIHVIWEYLTLLSEGHYPTPRALRRHDDLKEFYAHFLRVSDVLREREAKHLQLVGEVVASMRAALARAPELSAAAEALEREAASRREAIADGSSLQPAEEEREFGP
jgi:hypothetical protein